MVGIPQGATISPLLANVYLHYVLDLWVEAWRKRHARGEVYIVRYADDYITAFQYRFHPHLRAPSHGRVLYRSEENPRQAAQDESPCSHQGAEAETTRPRASAGQVDPKCRAWVLQLPRSARQLSSAVPVSSAGSVRMAARAPATESERQALDLVSDAKAPRHVAAAGPNSAPLSQ